MYRTNLNTINTIQAESNGSLIQTFLAATNRNVPSIAISDTRFIVKIAQTPEEIDAVLRLRYKVFKVEIGKEPDTLSGVEEDEFDSTSHHLIAVEKSSRRVVGVYRLRTAELMRDGLGFYSEQEFDLSVLPAEVLTQSVEIGRACIDPEFRNTKVLFLLWRGLASYVLKMKKRFLFGCCSLFSQNTEDGKKAFVQLKRNGQLHRKFYVSPKTDEPSEIEADLSFAATAEIELPKLFTSYLRIGAKVCSPPVIDCEFGTIDFFVIFEIDKIEERYYKMFFAPAAENREMPVA